MKASGECYGMIHREKLAGIASAERLCTPCKNKNASPHVSIAIGITGSETQMTPLVYLIMKAIVSFDAFSAACTKMIRFRNGFNTWGHVMRTESFACKDESTADTPPTESVLLAPDIVITDPLYACFVSFPT
jgi:hypothetical protein